MGSNRFTSLTKGSVARKAGADPDKPLITLITINYNSSAKIDLVLTCFKAMLNLKRRPLQLLYVDNGSKDASFDKIKEFSKTHPHDGLDLVFLPLPANLGFGRANNEGLKAADKSSKYVVVMNNDLAPKSGSLDHLVDFLENHPEFAGAQPIVMDWDGLKINVAGCIFTFWGASGLGSGLSKGSVKIPFLVSHLYGAYSVYRISDVRRAGGLFLPFFFMYGDDYELGARLWSNGYQLGLVPIEGGRHYGAATTRESKINLYYRLKNETAVLVMYSGTFSFLVLMRTLGVIGYGLVRNQREKVRAFVDGIVFGRKLRRNLPKRLKSAMSYVPRTNFSLKDYVFMHSHLATRPETQSEILEKMMEEHPLV